MEQNEKIGQNLQYYVIPKPDLFYSLSLYHKKYINSRFYDLRIKSKTYVNRRKQHIENFNELPKLWSGKKISVFQVLIKKEDKFYLCGIPVFLREILVKRIEKTPLGNLGKQGLHNVWGYSILYISPTLQSLNSFGVLRDYGIISYNFKTGFFF